MLDLAKLKSFTKEHYARHLVLKTPNVEIIVVCWMPGQGSPIHGHGPTDGVIVVLDGEIQNTNIYPDGRRISNVWRPGHILHTPVGVQHQVTNSSNAETVTLHIYAPPLQPEFKNPDLGYTNEETLREVPLPDDVAQILMASIPTDPEELKKAGYEI